MFPNIINNRIKIITKLIGTTFVKRAVART